MPDEGPDPVKGEPKYAQFELMQSSTRAMIGAGTWGASIDLRANNFFRAAAGFMAHPTLRIHKFCLLALKWLASNPSYKQYGAPEVYSLLLSKRPTVPLGAGTPESWAGGSLRPSATRDPRAVTVEARVREHAGVRVVRQPLLGQG